MGTAEVEARASAGAQRCECGHPAQRHELPGFDGECVSEGCRCTTYRPRLTAVAPALLGRPVPTPVRSGIEQMIAQGKRSQSKRTRALVDRLESEVADLYGRLKAERAMVAAQAAAASAKQVIDAPLPATVPLPADDLDTKPEPAPSVARPCPVDGCEFVAGNPQGLASHNRSVHIGVPQVACPDCGKAVRNLGVHRYHAHGIRAAS